MFTVILRTLFHEFPRGNTYRFPWFGDAKVCANDQEVSEVEAWQALNLSAAYIFFYELGA